MGNNEDLLKELTQKPILRVDGKLMKV